MVIAASKEIKTVPSHKEKKRSVFMRLLPFLIWQIIAVVFVESILFVAGLGEEEIFKLDPELGSMHMTNKRITWRSEGFGRSYLNEDGMREPGLTIAKPENTYRIAFMGDSLVEGMQVPFEQTFGQLLNQDLLGKINGKKVQVLNFATSGYSTAQEYLQLKRKVLKYQPDLIVLGYNSRDIFENWSPSDQVITNVRPYALHLPGGNLVVDSSPVLAWLRSPRAKFLQQIEWIRQNSRLWGLFAAFELDMSMHNDGYRFLLRFLTSPKKAFTELWATYKANQKKEAPPSSPAAATASAPNSAPAAVANHVATKAAPVKTKPVAPLVSAAEGQKIYTALISKTMGSLLAGMDKNSQAAGAKFAVILFPVRAALCPDASMETAFCNIKYAEERSIMTKLCHDQHIPLYDCQRAAEKLPKPQQRDLFYAVHFNATGHKFVAAAIAPFINNIAQGNSEESSSK